MEKLSPFKFELAQQISGSAREAATATLFFHQGVATQLGLNPTDLKCAEIVAQAGSISAGELASRCGLTTGSVTTMLDRLESRGFVRRERDPNDRRRVLVRPVPDPEQAARIEEMFRPLESGMIELCEPYSEEQLRMILEFLRGTRELLEGAARRLQPED